MYATKQSSIEYENCPAGMHHAVCYRVVDLGTQKTEWQGQEKQQRKVLISWELPNELMEPYTDGEGREHPPRPFTMHKRYTLSFNEKANLLKDLNSWRGRAFTEDELSGPPNGFYMRDIINANCFLNVIHNDADNGKTYANVAAVAPLAKGMEKIEPSNNPLFLDLSSADVFDQPAFDELSDGIKDTIRKSPEYQHIMGKDNQDTGHNTGSASNHAQENPPMNAYENEAAF